MGKVVARETRGAGSSQIGSRCTVTPRTRGAGSSRVVNAPLVTPTPRRERDAEEVGDVLGGEDLPILYHVHLAFSMPTITR